ncbi:MAG: methyltransferase [Bacteroidales bacterium]|nr:methyltransferase [Bacteroidales bacterium]
MKFFKFKQFKITDDRSAMKVGTDSVILGSWVCNHKIANVLDIGGGSGLISLMIAQRIQSAKIVSVEIDVESAKDSAFNFSNSPWNDRIALFRDDIRSFTSNAKFDLIISNPPFFTESLLPPKTARAGARHDDNLSLRELLEAVSNLLDNDGLFAVVYPFLREKELVEYAKKIGLFPHRILHTKNKPNAVFKRSFIEFRRIESENTIGEILEIRNEQSIYSNKYKELTKEFYLNF